MSSIETQLSIVKSRIQRACIASGRDVNSVRLIAVSKRMPSEAIREAYAAGQRDFGENYVQELLRKSEELADLPDLRLHLIGHLQTNKVKTVVRAVSMIQSIDSLRLVEELGKRVLLPAVVEARRILLGEDGAQTKTSLDARLPVLVEVNVAGEAQKSGCSPNDVENLIEAIERLPQVYACGLMTVPPFTDDPKEARPYFDALRALRDRLGGPSRLPELSMGMTADLEEAIAAGATIVRIGTAIFGARPAREEP
jgi:pyridoxal phosphate enzyme (YggS family)